MFPQQECFFAAYGHSARPDFCQKGAFATAKATVKSIYETYIPVLSRYSPEEDKQVLLKELSLVNPDIVCLIYLRPAGNPEEEEKKLCLFRENKNFPEENGFTVGVWFCPTIGYGGPAGEGKGAYQRITGADGKGTNAFCPLDDAFCDDLTRQFTRLAETGVKYILLEDDFTLTGGKLWVEFPGCTCPLHMKKLGAALGREITREELLPCLKQGEKNEYRTVFCRLMGETLQKAAKTVEAPCTRWTRQSGSAFRPTPLPGT